MKDGFRQTHLVLCEVHFEDEMWEKTREDGSRKLKWSAVPTLFSFVEKKVSRKPPALRVAVQDLNEINIPSTSADLSADQKADVDSSDTSNDESLSSADKHANAELLSQIYTINKMYRSKCKRLLQTKKNV